MSALPPGAVAYKSTPVFTEDTVPAGLLRDHTTKAGVWGRIEVEVGALRYVVQHQPPQLLTPTEPGVVEPQVPHHVEPLGPVRFRVVFLRVPAR